MTKNFIVRPENEVRTETKRVELKYRHAKHLTFVVSKKLQESLYETDVKFGKYIRGVLQ